MSVNSSSGSRRNKRPYYSVKVGQEDFTIDERYTQLKLIGCGSYGSVASAVDQKTKRKVAIKRILRPFQDEVRGLRILREIKLLLHFNRHENIIGVQDVMTSPQDSLILDEVYIVCSLMESDLEQIISSDQELTEQHVKYFLYQILRGISFVHNSNVVHRDLKPGNILVNSNCDLAICDFGLSRGVEGDVDIGLTEYVVTRWYRAPELLCDESTYVSTCICICIMNVRFCLGTCVNGRLHCSGEKCRYLVGRVYFCRVT